MLSNVFKIRAVEEIMWIIIVEPGSPQMPVWCMRIACLILKSTNTHSEYVMLIAFHCKNTCRNEPECYVMGKLNVL
jgi:hypothetical protein